LVVFYHVFYPFTTPTFGPVVWEVAVNGNILFGGNDAKKMIDCFIMCIIPMRSGRRSQVNGLALWDDKGQATVIEWEKLWNGTNTCAA
jgi:hypothetical protein